MIGRRAASHAAVVLLGLSVGIACDPIEGTPLVRAPVNACPEHACELYASAERSRPSCNGGRCDVGRGLPTYPFTVVVNVPDTSFYAPGRTFLLPKSDFEPASATASPRACAPPCIQLPPLALTEGKYRVTSKAAADVGFPLVLDDGTSLPVRVTDIRLEGDGADFAIDGGLPVDPLFAKSRRLRQSREGPFEVFHQNVVPVGRYLRVLDPEPPYDAYFPPVAREIAVAEPLADDFVLGAAETPLDDESGDTRRTLVRRTGGLAGWRVWLEDTRTSRRVSSIRTLSGTEAEARLDTFRQNAQGASALRDGIRVVVAPPASWLGVPELRSELIGGQGLRPLVYPALPEPATVRGILATGAQGDLTGVPATLTFTSDALRLPDGTTQQLLVYKTSVSTDASGGFTTVLPPGNYDILIDPAEGTGFARSRERLDVTGSLAKTFTPKPRIVATGRAVLTDERPLGAAEIFAMPSRFDASSPEPRPRPARTLTAPDGTFTLELDPGMYDLFVDPQAGTGYPRVVLTRKVLTASLETIADIRVPPPTRFSFTLRDFNLTLSGNPIVRAIVRVFAAPQADPGARPPPAIEVGRAMTNEKGECEILLAQQPR
ncbi:MAG: hypothetical protein KF819_00265 [Labilithrix sp.]|nr:hypothetical protein [Labilithrix sp.]